MEQTKDVWSACDGEVTVAFSRNDYLDTRAGKFGTNMCESPSGHPAENTMCSVFADDGTLAKFDTLVVNSGAHYRKTKEYGPAMALTGRVLADSMRRLHGDDAILVARNTPPGHWNCTKR